MLYGTKFCLWSHYSMIVFVAAILINFGYQSYFTMGESVGWTEFKCPDGHHLTQIESMFQEWNAEKRMYSFGCSALAEVAQRTQCSWTRPADTTHGDMFLACGTSSAYVAGVSILKQGHGNQWKLRCCQALGLRVREEGCYQTHLLNDWRGPLKYSIPPLTVSRKWQSLYNESKEDRKWWLEICPFYFAQNSDPESVSIVSNYGTPRQQNQNLQSPSKPQQFATTKTTMSTTTPTTEVPVTTTAEYFTYAETTEEPDLAESLQSYQQRELQFQRMLSQIALQPVNAPVIPPDLLKAAYGWYPPQDVGDRIGPAIYGNSPSGHFDSPDSGLNGVRKSSSKPAAQPANSHLQTTAQDYGNYGNPKHFPTILANVDSEPIIIQRSNFDSKTTREQAFASSDASTVENTGTPASESIILPNQFKINQESIKVSAPTSNSGGLPERPRLPGGDATLQANNLPSHQVITSTQNSLGGGSGGGLPPRPKISGSLSLDLEDLGMVSEHELNAKPLMPSGSTGGPNLDSDHVTKTLSENEKGENFVDMLGGASDFLSNMHKGVKFAFSDDEGNFSFKDGLSTTLDFFGLCGNANRRKR